MTNNKELFMKWIQNLFYVQCAMLVGYLIEYLPFADGWFRWVNLVLSLAGAYVLYQLIPVNARYRKAVIFTGIAIVIRFVGNLVEVSALSLGMSICVLIGLYQEFSAHSEMLDGIDHRLSRKWHTLFNWNIFSSIIAGFLGGALLIIGVLLEVDTNVLVVVEIAMIIAVEVIIRVVYLIYLKRMLAAYANYEPQVEEVVTEEI